MSPAEREALATTGYVLNPVTHVRGEIEASTSFLDISDDDVIIEDVTETNNRYAYLLYRCDLITNSCLICG